MNAAGTSDQLPLPRRDPKQERIEQLEAALVITTAALRDCVRSLRRSEGEK